MEKAIFKVLKFLFAKQSLQFCSNIIPHFIYIASRDTSNSGSLIRHQKRALTLRVKPIHRPLIQRDVNFQIFYFENLKNTDEMLWSIRLVKICSTGYDSRTSHNFCWKRERKRVAWIAKACVTKKSKKGNRRSRKLYYNLM